MGVFLLLCWVATLAVSYFGAVALLKKYDLF